MADQADTDSSEQHTSRGEGPVQYRRVLPSDPMGLRPPRQVDNGDRITLVDGAPQAPVDFFLCLDQLAICGTELISDLIMHNPRIALMTGIIVVFLLAALGKNYSSHDLTLGAVNMLTV